MKFPASFTDWNKRRAAALRRKYPGLSNGDIIRHVVEEIRAGKTKAFAPSVATKTIDRKKTRSPKPKTPNVFWRRLPGSFESAQR